MHLGIPACTTGDDTAKTNVEVIVEAVAAIYTPISAFELTSLFTFLCLHLPSHG